MGLIISFVISLTISFKQKWFWLNSLIVFIRAFTLGRLDYLGWQNLKVIFLKPGHLFDNEIFFILTNGFVLLSIGVFVFSFKPFNNFIDNNRLAVANH